MPTTLLDIVAALEIPGLIAQSGSDGSSAVLITPHEAVPLEFRPKPDGTVKTALRATVASDPPEVRDYARAAARDAGFDWEVRGGEIWLWTRINPTPQALDLLSDVCKLAKLVADAIAWLRWDDHARKHWSSARSLNKGGNEQ